MSQIQIQTQHTIEEIEWAIKDARSAIACHKGEIDYLTQLIVFWQSDITKLKGSQNVYDARADALSQLD